MAVFALRKIEEVLSTPKSRKQLLELTNLPDRTLRYNISLLKKQGRIREVLVLEDMRRKAYVISAHTSVLGVIE